jgi:hypothetical protein
MFGPTPKLQPGASGRYGDLSGRELPGDLAFLFVPSLAALLDRAEQLKGGPLTEDEVLQIRDAALVTVAPADVVQAVEAERGYAEVDRTDPLRSWEALLQGDV